MELHLQQHTEGKAYKCTTCGRGFDDHSTLNKHVRIHSGEKPFKCPTCPKTFRQSGTMHRHVLALHSPQANASTANRARCARAKESTSSDEKDSSSNYQDAGVIQAEVVDS